VKYSDNGLRPLVDSAIPRGGKRPLA